MNAFKPSAGQLYVKGFNDGIRVLVITPIKKHANDNGGWLALGLPVYRNGSYGRPMLVSIHLEDICKGRHRLPQCAALALRRHRAIQRRARAAYVGFDGCERDGYYYAAGV